MTNLVSTHLHKSDKSASHEFDAGGQENYLPQGDYERERVKALRQCLLHIIKETKL